jgi:hypothetical protein
VEAGGIDDVVVAGGTVDVMGAGGTKMTGVVVGVDGAVVVDVGVEMVGSAVARLQRNDVGNADGGVIGVADVGQEVGGCDGDGVTGSVYWWMVRVMA